MEVVIGIIFFVILLIMLVGKHFDNLSDEIIKEIKRFEPYKNQETLMQNLERANRSFDIEYDPFLTLSSMKIYEYVKWRLPKKNILLEYKKNTMNVGFEEDKIFKSISISSEAKWIGNELVDNLQGLYIDAALDEHGNIQNINITLNNNIDNPYAKKLADEFKKKGYTVKNFSL